MITWVNLRNVRLRERKYPETKGYVLCHSTDTEFYKRQVKSMVIDGRSVVAWSRAGGWKKGEEGILRYGGQSLYLQWFLFFLPQAATARPSGN